MYPAHTVVLLLICDICFASQNVLMSNLVAINSRKMEIRKNTVESGIPFISGGPCVSLKRSSKRQRYALYVDHYIDYPVKLLRLQGSNVSSRARGPLNIYSQKRKVLGVELSNSVRDIPLKPSLFGRAFVIRARIEVSICLLEAYTCKPGKRGEFCDQDCLAGTYGLGCKQRCQCHANKPCNSVTGHCKNGCRGAPNVPQLCYQNIVGTAMNDHYRKTTADLNAVIHGPTMDLKSAKFHDTSERCIQFFTTCKSRTLYLKLVFSRPVTLYGVDFAVTKFNVPTPYSFSITADGKPCSGGTYFYKSIQLGRQSTTCVRQNATGKNVLIRLTTHDLTTYLNSEFVGVNVCDIKVKECSTGFHGPSCRRLCKCANGNTDCDHVTGACPDNLCSGNAKGRFCTTIDISANMHVTRRFFHSEHMNDYGELETSGSYFDPELDGHVSWMAYQLDGTYQINSVTLVIPEQERDQTRQLNIYTQPFVRSGSSQQRWKPFRWRGLPCIAPGLGQGADEIEVHVPCPGFARTLFVVKIANTSVSYLPSYGVKVWACVDGTFGRDCEYRCNCENTQEVCDKTSGFCVSGCAKGHKGTNCLEPCRRDDPDPVCPSRSCQCHGPSLKDCGPVIRLCSRGCRQGYMGLSCIVPCPKGRFGYNCEEKCGDCKYDPAGRKDGTCLYTNGTCPLGCANPDDYGPTCLNTTVPEPRPTGEGPLRPSRREDRFRKAIEESSFRVIIGLIGVTIACTSVVIIVCCSLKCYWDRLAHTQRLNEKRVDMIMRRALRSKVDTKLQNQHQEFHEEYIKRDLLKKMGNSVDLPPEGSKMTKVRAKAKAEAMRKMILEMELQRRKLRGIGPEEEDVDNEEQDPNDKVAKWILTQDFSELIERRRKRLKEYTGNTLYITESPYRLSDASVIKDVHKLYDDLEALAIP